MVKKFTLFILLGIFGLFTTNLFAQEDATIDPADIRYWIGEGQNEAIFIMNWNNPDTALAWGYRFDTENVTMKTIMDDIAAVDYRFSYDSPNGSWLNDLFFNDGVLDLSLTEEGWVSYLIDGNPTWDTFNEAVVADGQYVKIGDTYCGTMVDPDNWVYVWEKEVAAVYPLADEATIDVADIVYWIGEGENYAIYCVNWNEPNIALAWGYRFTESTITVKDVMDAIVAEDHRLTYAADGGFVYAISYNDYVNQYALVGPYFMYNINGMGAWYGFDEQTVVSGDFIKFGDISCATEIAQWTYVWEQPVQPVDVYNSVNEVEASTMTVYPNPATDFIMINTQDAVSVEIFDMTGRLVLTSTETKIDIRDMEAGVYFVRANGKTTKLIVK